LIVVSEDPRVVDESRTDFIGQAARQPIEMVSRSEVADALQRLGGSCLDKGGCLEKLCAATGATYALFASLDLKGTKFVLKARVVAADGSEARVVSSLEIEKDLLSPRARQVQAAFKQLYTQLDLGSLPATLPQKPAPPVVVAPPPAAVVAPPPVAPAPVAPPLEPIIVEEPPRGTPPLRVAGWVVGVAGVLTAAVGGGLAGWASLDARGIDTVQLSGKTFVVRETDVRRAAEINDRGDVAKGLLIGGGVAIAAAATMMILSIDSGPRLVATPIPGGAFVGATGEF
jgi:hypothetical protein